jgi:hypothetical protein
LKVGANESSATDSEADGNKKLVLNNIFVVDFSQRYTAIQNKIWAFPEGITLGSPISQI